MGHTLVPVRPHFLHLLKTSPDWNLIKNTHGMTPMCYIGLCPCLPLPEVLHRVTGQATPDPTWTEWFLFHLQCTMTGDKNGGPHARGSDVTVGGAITFALGLHCGGKSDPEHQVTA